jgi:hypothetical protein
MQAPMTALDKDSSGPVDRIWTLQALPMVAGQY